MCCWSHCSLNSFWRRRLRWKVMLKWSLHLYFKLLLLTIESSLVTLIRLSLFIFLRQCAPSHLAIKCSFLLYVNKTLALLCVCSICLFLNHFLSVQWTILWTWYCMLLTITAVHSYFQLMSCACLSCPIFGDTWLILRTCDRIWNWILRTMAYTWECSWCVCFRILTMIRSFAITANIAIITHLLTGTRLLTIGTYKRSTRSRRTDIGTLSFIWNLSTGLSTMEFSLFWVQNNWWWKILNHLYLFLSESSLLGSCVHCLHMLLCWITLLLISFGGTLGRSSVCNWRSMLEELFIHFLAHLTIFLCLNLFDLPIINSILIVHKILKSIMTHDQIIFISYILSLLGFLLTLNLICWRSWWRKIRMRRLLASNGSKTFGLGKTALLYFAVFILQSMVALGAANYCRVDTWCQILILCWFDHLFFEFI